MRIESIRIFNLASLRGEQPAIELRGEVFGEAGLIAVTGPTGAGKTTLFDAVCLALYDETPRTRGRGRDPRDLLSRGAGEAQVEVALRLDNGAAWRAEWSVHRARSQAGGLLQQSRQRIVDAATGEVLAEGKKQVQALVEQNLDLSFDQFTSVVLIAQGQFAEFLEATDADRSALLERLTGTEIYSDLSRAAYERARVLQDKVAELEKVAGHLGGLGESERLSLEEDLRQVQQALLAQESQVEAQARIVQQLGELLALLGHRAQAQNELTLARACNEESEADRQGCRAAERAAIASRALQSAEELRRRLAQARQDAQERLEAEGKAAKARSGARSELERRLGELTASCRLAAADFEARQGAAAIEGETLEALRALARAREQARRQAERRQEEAQQAEAELEACQAENLQAAQDLHSCRGDLEAQSAGKSKLAAEVALLAEGRSRDEWARRRLDLQDAKSIADELARLDLDKLDREGKQAQRQVTLASGERDKARQELALRRRDREQHEHLLRLATGQAELAEHRPSLVPGEPCPLCGSPHHPFRHRLAAEDRGVLRQAEEEKAQKQIFERQAEAALAAADHAHQAALLAAKKAQTQLESANQQVKHARGRWLGLRLSLPELPVVATRFETPELPQIDARLARFDQLLPALDRAAQALDAAEQALARQEQALAVAGERLQAAERRRSEAAEALAEASLEAGKAAAGFELRACELAAQVGLAPPDAGDAEGAVAFLAELEEQLAAFKASRQRKEKLEALAERLRRSRPELEPLAGAEPGDSSFEALEKALEAALAAERSSQEQFRLEEDRHRRAVAEVEEIESEARQAEEALTAAIAEQLFASEEELRAALLSPPELAALRRRLEELQREVERKESRLQSVEQDLSALRERAGTALDFEDPVGEKTSQDQLLADAKQAQAELLGRMVELRSKLQAEEDRRDQRESLAADLAAKKAQYDLASRLSSLIGQKDGGKFRRFAQQLNLDLLLELANLRLDRLAPRYLLARLGDTLELEVIDREMADERRPVNTLSGGESFLVSLALALALADLRRGSLRLGTLFLDEGFGSLDEDTLDTALSVLEQLQADQNTQILIISHVGALKERIDHRIDIQKLGGGRSRISILGGPAA